MVKKIALEEHFLSPGFEDYWKTTAGEIALEIYRQAAARLVEFGDLRLAVMDRGGVERAVLSIAGPGVQIERDTATAVRRARESNDFLAREVQKRPDRYSGFAHLAMQDGKAAAAELERAMREHGIADYHSIALAVLEVDGSISMMKYDDIKPTASTHLARRKFLQKKT